MLLNMYNTTYFSDIEPKQFVLVSKSTYAFDKLTYFCLKSIRMYVDSNTISSAWIFADNFNYHFIGSNIYEQSEQQCDHPSNY
jgi:hypothetical protein